MQKKGGAIYNEEMYNITDTTFNNNTPANFIITENNTIHLENDDNFINIHDFIVISDFETYHGNGIAELERYTIPTISFSVKLIFNGTRQTNSIFILKTDKKESTVAVDELTTKTLVMEVQQTLLQHL